MSDVEVWAHIRTLEQEVAKLKGESPATVPVFELIELAIEFEQRSRSGQVTDSEAEGNAMRATWAAAALAIRARIPR
jgi:hypothetical protein